MAMVQVEIEGMHCGGCVKRVEEALAKAGVAAERVEIGRATVLTQAEGAAGVGERIVAALDKLGFEARVVPAAGGV